MAGFPREAVKGPPALLPADGHSNGHANGTSTGKARSRQGSSSSSSAEGLPAQDMFNGVSRPLLDWAEDDSNPEGRTRYAAPC